MKHHDTRRGLSFGFGLSGLCAAGLAYLAFEAGGVWQSPVIAVLIGGGSAALLLWVERLLRRGSPAGERRPAKIKGEWGCPSCGAAYVPEVTVCSDCHVPLVRANSDAT
jgi:hypothetical protein